jgi:hypothetical protein
LKKTIYSFLVGVLLSTASWAQVRVGITGSLQLASQQIKSQDITISGSNKAGFQAGLLLDAPLNDNISVRPQLLYSTKGGEYQIGSSSTFTTTFNYIEIPVQLTYGIEAGSGKAVVGVGPYLAYALNGNDKSGSVSTPIEFGSNDDQIKRIDYGLRVSAGYELPSGLGVSAYYAPGLANLANGNSGATLKNSAFGLSLSYFFGGN